MRIIITGGTGMIGKELGASFAADGHEVIALSRNPNRKSDMPAGIQLARWDAKTADGWGHLADGAGAIINLAGENLGGTSIIPSRWSDERKHRIDQSRIDAGAAVVEAVQAASNKPGVVVQASGVDYYPNGSTGQTENMPPGNSFLAHVVTHWEAATEPVEALGVRRVVARLGILLGREDGAYPRLLLPFQIGQMSGPLGGGQQAFPWVHHTDAVRALRYFVENSQLHGVYNVVAPESTTNAEFTRAMGRVLNRPAFLPVPAFALRLVLGEVAGLVLDGRDVSSQKLLDTGFSYQYPTSEAAIRNLQGK